MTGITVPADSGGCTRRLGETGDGDNAASVRKHGSGGTVVDVENSSYVGLKSIAALSSLLLLARRRRSSDGDGVPGA